ncbi:MAG TPA: 50S ribosomal protein L9, partial [Ktedonobacterales bacterium]
VPGLGQPGDVKEVANGYARNFLLPRELVTAATPAALKNLQQRVAATRRRTETQAADHKALAERIAAVTLTFAVHVGRGDRLYGSVTSQNIADALQEQEGLRIDRRTIHLPEPLRQLGTYEVPVRVATKLEPKVKVAIVAGESVSGNAAVSVPTVTAAAPETSEASETSEAGEAAPAE